jgi:hypothetical protein
LHVNTYAIFVFLHYFALAYLLHYNILLLAHICSDTLDHAEPKLEELTEQAQVEEFINLALDQGKPQCIQPMFFVFILNICFRLYLVDYALSR